MGLTPTGQNFTSVNEHATLNGEHVPYTAGYNFFLEGKRKRVIINSMNKRLS